VIFGRYVGAGLTRTEAIDCPVGTRAKHCQPPVVSGHGGYTYGDFPLIGGAPEVHASGEVWSQTLWDLRSALGHRVADMLITRGMSLSPNEPSMPDMRNAIIQADRAVYGGRHVKRIWQVFAHRGMGFFAGSLTSGDPNTVESFRLPPGHGAPRGTVRGRVIDRLTKRPIKNALVEIAGHRSGLLPNYADRTNAQGRYAIHRVVAAKYPGIIAFARGYHTISRTIRVRHSGTKEDFKPRRDWAATNGGGRITRFTGPDFAGFGCGPSDAIDLSPFSGWGSTAGDDAGTPTNVIVPKHIVVRLSATVTVSSFNVDPTATCGDPGSASTGAFRIATSANGTAWTKAVQGTFTTADQGRFNLVKPAAPIPGVRFVRFTMAGTQVPDFSHNCPNGPYAGCTFMDMSELEVYGTR
ncbi:MAG: extracellular elastinolytic metalloproteinase, partial [Nocardioidaceae bacterium]|nr:extracellular elastinolytic metalloproteinase [Nocardioidaceae bacterium]